MASADALVTLASALIESYEVTCACGSLLLYDHILSFGEEVEYFWTGPWSLSKLLYLAIRYTGLGFALYSFTAQNSTVQAPRTTPLHQPTVLMVKLFVFVLPINTLCQLVITLRIWFLFSRNLVVKIFSVALLVATITATTWLLAMQWGTIESEVLDPLTTPPSTNALVYVPSLVIHSALFALQVYRFLTSSVRMKTKSLLWGFVKEGMFMYAFLLASLLFGVVGLMMTEPSQLPIRIPAGVGSPIVASIVSVCRMMLNIRSVAATGHVDPEWLLNNAEFTRVYWRRGNVDGEIIVEAGESPIAIDTILESPTSVRYSHKK